MRTKEWQPVDRVALVSRDVPEFRNRRGWTLVRWFDKRNWTVSGQWDLRDPQGNVVDKYDFYGTVKINPPTTWANKIIKERQAA